MRIMILNHTFVQDINSESAARITALFKSYASPGTTLEFHHPDDLGGGEVLHHARKGKSLAGLHHIMETPALVKKIIAAERSGFDAVMQSNTFDPGVEAGRLAVRIPVVGVMRSSCHFAACLCDRFGIIVPLESYVPYVSRTVDTYRMGHFVTAIRAINLFEVGDLSSYHDIILERTVAVARELIAGGAQAIVPLAARLIPYAAAPEEVEQEVGVPVINTIRAGMRFAELMASSGISHSQKAYPYSPGLNPEDVSRRS